MAAAFYETLECLLRGFEMCTRILGPLLILVAIGLISLVTLTYFDAVMPSLGIPAFSFFWLIITSLGIWILINILFNYAAAALLSPGHPDIPSTLPKTGCLTPAAQAADVRLISSPRPGRRAGAGATAAVSGSGAAAASAAAGGRRRLQDLESGGGGGVEDEDADDDTPINKGSATVLQGSVNGNSASTYQDDDDGSDGGGVYEGTPMNRHCSKCDNAPKPLRTHHCHICNKCVLKMDHHCPW